MSPHFREEEFIPYLDGRLPGPERARLDEHLAGCADCRAHLDEFRALVGVLGEWRAADPSVGFDAALRARLAVEKAAGTGWPILRPAYAAIGIMALLVVVGVGRWLLTPPETSPGQQAAQTGVVAVAPSAPETPPAVLPNSDELVVLDNQVLLENYELLEEFDVLFEPLNEEEKKL